MFWDNYERLCKSKGLSASAVAKELGFSNATASGWKSGSMPKMTTLEKIADYFNVSKEDLLSDAETNKSSIPKNAGREIIQTLFDLMKPEDQADILQRIFEKLKDPSNTSISNTDLPK